MIMYKDCVIQERREAELKTLGASIPEVLALSHAGTGFYIQQRYLGDGLPLCLAIGEEITEPISDKSGGGEGPLSKIGGNANTREEIVSEEMPYSDTMSEDQSYLLTWASCADQGARWILREVEHADIVTSANEDEYRLYTVHPQNNPGMCFDTVLNKSNRTQVILTKCKNSFRAIAEETQLMYLETYTLSHSLGASASPSYSIFSAFKKNLQNQKNRLKILHTGTNPSKLEALYGLKFLDPGDVLTRFCSLSQLSTLNGRVRNEYGLPFVLYGQKVEVRCDPGYGVRSLNYSGLQTILCTNTSRALPCRRIGSNSKKKNKSSKNRGGRSGGGSGVLDLTLVVAIASSVIAAILAAVLAVTLRRRKRGS